MSDTAITPTAIFEGGEVLESWWARLAVAEEGTMDAEIKEVMGRVVGRPRLRG
eukprot:CAMPEP_0203964696 /NCGR_PEP_ID=MMETSP0359-20131031/94383_1 /ASSEMBLY_ACC=CAM_ASM_000338 /TAXON_ID=268821 /ORGANISM="Scrippsiella Hangoei, Strain SHTV-5" /LENGTH=52 /DNA_ID=CAMNT_0050901255 /DNA_START=162 /DNA_END=317 /DNA_ORIENTATION=+